jgi:hypothetical protein
MRHRFGTAFEPIESHFISKWPWDNVLTVAIALGLSAEYHGSSDGRGERGYAQFVNAKTSHES